MTTPTYITSRGLIVWLVCALFFMYEFLLRTVLGIFQQPIMAELQLSSLGFALLSSTSYQIIYGLMQIPVGIISDRFGLKKTLFMAVIICVLAAIGLSFSSSISSALLFRALMGFGSAFGFVCLLIAVYNWLPRKNIALFIGLSQFIGTLGPMLAAGPLNMLSEQAMISWRTILLCLAAIGTLIAVLVLLFVDKNRQAQGKFLSLKHPAPMWHGLQYLINKKQIWFIAIFSAFVYFSLEYLSENECKEFLSKKGFSANFSAYMITLAWLSYAFGCAFLGYLSDKLQRRKSLMLVSAITALISLTAIIYLPLNEFLITLSFIGLGAGASGQSLGFAIMAEQCRETHIAIGLGFNNAMIGFFSAIISPLIGFLLSHNSYTPGLANYQQAFFVMIILLMVAVILAFFFIKETFCKSMRENTLLAPDSMAGNQPIV